MNDELEMIAFYRATAKGEPPAALDGAVLNAARHQQRSAREIGTLAALAATLIFAVVLSLPQPPQPKLPPESATYGLYEGRAALFLRDPQAIQQSIIRQMPGATD